MFSASILLQILLECVAINTVIGLVHYITTGGQCFQKLVMPLNKPGYLLMIDNKKLLLFTALMYVLVPMPCLFFGGGSTQFLTSRDGGGWIDAAKFLTGASAVGSFAIPIILRHAHMISTGAMFIEFTSFIIFVCTVLCFHRASLEDDW
ncbi:hypothetical protein CXB51_022611 [Gossypium anomalum]|uniref:Vacuolar protein sorting 55 n=2 Tax=Gossypium TaxID=3633 RepID=A0A8J6CVG8_9ROSI|nr:hypothetical protein CXB51_022611 [Gossypium anomalum]